MSSSWYGWTEREDGRARRPGGHVPGRGGSDRGRWRSPVWASGVNHAATRTEAEKEKLRRQSRSSREDRRPRASAASGPCLEAPGLRGGRQSQVQLAGSGQWAAPGSRG